MRGEILTCSECGTRDIDVVARVAARTCTVRSIDYDEQAFCTRCRAYVDIASEDVDEVDPEWWTSNGFRCDEPACVPRKGCPSCELYRCASCAEVRRWSDGGAPDPRCDSCYGADPDEHVELVVPVALLRTVLVALHERAEPMARQAAVVAQAIAYVVHNQGAVSAPYYAEARAAVDTWLRMGRFVDDVAARLEIKQGAEAPKEK